MMERGEERWFDEAAGPLVRPYTMTRGRTRHDSPDLDMLTQVTAARRGSPDRSGLSVEHLEILELCARPLSVAEVAAYLDVPMGVVKVLISDLLQRADLITGASAGLLDRPDRQLLQAVLDGVRAL